ncbi:MAG: homocysteine S-methyltransferase family protein [Chloroflexota bacterium]
MPLVADGAMGTELQARSGLAGPSCRLNLLAPELVLALHREYLAAGARLLVTNTLGASPDEARAGVRLAREAASRAPASRTSVAGSSLDREAASHPPARRRDIARSRPARQTADPKVPASTPTSAQVIAALRVALGLAGSQHTIVAGSVVCEPEPAEALLAALGEADLLILETVTSFEGLDATVASIRTQSSQPVIATLSFAEDGTLDGFSPAEVAGRIQALELDGWGYGCGFGPEAASRVMTELRRAAPKALLVAKPNLGLPHNGAYAITPAHLAGWANSMTSLGIQIIGACCGSTPAHTRAMAASLVD